MYRLRSLGLVALLALIPACGDESGSTGQDTPPLGDVTAGLNQYAGSASYGDVVTFDIDPVARTYTVHNETTGASASGSYAVQPNELAGIYKVVVGTDTFYAVELTDRLLAANFPTGNPGNTLSFGLAAKPLPADWQAHFAGDYSYIMISNEPVNGSTDNKEWGVVTVAADGTFKVRMFGTGGTGKGSHPAMAPEEFTQAMMPATDPDLTGTWQADAAHPARLVINIDQQPGQTRTGFVYADGSQASFMIDNGPGLGFLLAFKVSEMNLAATAGDYKFINVFNGDKSTGRSAGKVTINNNGTGSYAHLDQNGAVTTGTLDTIAQAPVLKNMFYASTTETTGTTVQHFKRYWVITGQFFLSFGFRTDNGEFRFANYSAGARLD